MIEVIAEHLIETSLLPEKAVIADLGCRNFLFTNEMRRKGYIVYAVDVDQIEGGEYMRAAISDFDGMCGFTQEADKQATKIDKLGTGIDCYTIETLMRVLNISFFDLVKYDIEGAEFESIMTLTKPIAKQLSIEFHLHTGVYTMHEVELMVDKLKGLGYEIASHEYTSQHGAGHNFWSSLFILK